MPEATPPSPVAAGSLTPLGTGSTADDGDEAVIRVRAVALGPLPGGEELVGTVEHSPDLPIGTPVALHVPGWLASMHSEDGEARRAVDDASGASGLPSPHTPLTQSALILPTVTAPTRALTPFSSSLPWHLLAAVPGPVRTAHACLDALALGPGDSVFVREADSPLGATLCVLARRRGVRVVAATRDVRRVSTLTALGLGDVLLDDAHLAPRVREILPAGADAAIEAAPVPTDADTQAALGVDGRLWVSEEAASPGARPLPARVLQTFLDEVPAGRAPVFVDSVLALSAVGQALRRVESGRARSAVVLVTRDADLPEPGRLGAVADPLVLRG